ncbi:Malonyl CoA-acyl carrier protein transacylase [Chondromyces apiculatus DSM 436]|uniref:Malonyl CoA-acyl carrier protein transacylase n=1 Tax=Chondromyces apiculatus DSM 436 TaxID=1192034 RepID=A0A017ST21_9BACT|nr:Malonyl CoA-acyl carrier protein transacylase [Chondromyces apiculatus DSM 436]
MAFRAALPLSDRAAHAVQVMLAVDTRGTASFRVSARSEEQSGAEAGWTLHATGKLRLEPAGEAECRTPVAIDALQDRCVDVVSGDAHYAALAARGMHYGPAFQGVQRVWRRDGEALGRVHALRAADGEGALHALDPALLDACLQVVVAALPRSGGREAVENALVPVRIEGLRRSSQAWTDEVWSHAVLRPGERAAPGEIEADIQIVNAEGRLLLDVRGLHVRASNAKAARASDALHGWFLQIGWHPQALSRLAGAPSPGTWILLADRGGLAERLQQLLELRRQRCVLLRADDVSGAAGSSAGAVAPTSAEGWRQLLGALPRAGAPCRGIVCLWPLDETSTAEVTPASLHEAALRGSERLVALVQGLALVDLSVTPRLWVVTGDVEAAEEQGAAASPASPASPASLAEAPLWGLIRAMAYEHPELRPGCIDIPGKGAVEHAEALVEEFLADGPESQVKLRGDARHVARLVRNADVAPRDEEVLPSAWAATGSEGGLRLDVRVPGLLDTLSLRPAPRPQPGPGQVEIRVHAAGLNFLDVLSAMGVRPDDPGGPVALGLECAGTVSAVGEGVALHVGDAVIAVARSSFGTHVLAHAPLVVPKPEGLSFEEAASLPIAFMTAQYALAHLGHLARGERVLIHAGAGGVGLAAIQIAQRLGAEVFATAGSPEKQEHLRALGVPHVLHSRSLQFAGEIVARTGGRGVDLVLNSLTGPAIAAGLEVLAPYGRFVEIGKRDIYEDTPVGLGPFRKNLSYFAVDLARMLDEKPEACGRLLREVTDLAARGDLRPLPYRAFPITAAADAFRHMAQARHIGKVVLALEGAEAAVASASAPRVRADGCYLLTGGLGGLGLATARWLVAQGARHLVLVGRGDPSEAARAEIVALEAVGAQVKTARVDVASAGPLAALLADVRATMPPLRGVFHAAGVLDDGLMLQQTRARFDAVMRPKVLGAWNLHAATADCPLDLFVLYSSAAALLGSPGQASYCAGNAFLHALARYRRAAGRPAHCIAWGPWAEVGLAAAEDRRGARLAVRGLGSLTQEQGVEALGRVLRQDAAEMAVTPFNVRHWREFYPVTARSPLFDDADDLAADLAADRAEEGRIPQGTEAARQVRDELGALAPAARRARIEAHVREHLSRVTRLPPARIHSDTPLMSLGLDSLMSLELRNRLEAGLQLTLPATLMFGHTSLGSLASHLATRMGLGLEESAPEEVPARATEASRSTAEMDQLSADEMAALLAAKLSALTQAAK